jgi:membrane fusion protein
MGISRRPSHDGVPAAEQRSLQGLQGNPSAGSIVPSPGNTPAMRAGPAVHDHAPVSAGRSLFRREVLAERQTQWLGQVLLAPRISYHAFTVFSLLSAAAALATLVFGQYTQKARMNGWLMPEAGLIQVFVPKPGVVMRVEAHEGEQVSKGAPLVLLSTELLSESLGGVHQDIVSRLRSQRESLQEDKQRQQRLFNHQAQAMSDRLEVMKKERHYMQQQMDLVQAHIALVQRTVVRKQGLRARGLDTEERLEQSKTEEIEQGEKLQGLEVVRAGLDREIVQLQADLRSLPLQQQQQVADTERKIAVLDQQLAENEAQRQIVITAPEDGTVSAIQTSAGSSADVKVPLLSIIPAGSKLRAELFAPSRSIGFVRPGQRVLLRYDAFPYQKFGFYEGRVANVSHSTINPAELPSQLAGLTNIYGNEPVYRVTVALAQQTAVAYGSTVSLEAGMQLQADVMIEKRRLIEWILDPIFTLTGGRRT